MSVLIAIIGAIFAFFIVVLIHEAGHFWVARLLGIKVLRFSIGFGKPIVTYCAKSGVEFVIGFLPLGGYVKMQDMHNTPEKTAENVGSTGVAFESKSIYARMAVAAAGPFANFILAIFLFSIIFTIGVTKLKPVIGSVSPHTIAATAQLKPGDEIMQMGDTPTHDWQSVLLNLIAHIGDAQELRVTVLPKGLRQTKIRFLDLENWQFDPMQPSLLKSVGLTPYFPPIPAVIAVVTPQSPAANAGLLPKDRILSINQISMKDWQEVVTWVQAHPSKRVRLLIRRDDNNKIFSLVTGAQEVAGKPIGFLGIQPEPPTLPQWLQYRESYPWFMAAWPAIKETARWIDFQCIVLKKMILGQISMKTLSGPLSIFRTAGSASLAGLVSYLEFIAFLSVILGVLNLLPIPALDGGHFLFCVIEGLRGKPLSINVQILLINIGIIFLISVMLYATTNDLLRFFQ